MGYLRPIQIWSRVSFLKNINKAVSKTELDDKAGDINSFEFSIHSYIVFHYPATFTFLSQTHAFGKKIDWDIDSHGKLWTYNLNYFEYLEQPLMESAVGFQLIDDFLAEYKVRKAGREPYPTSLRLIFWVRFFLRTGVKPKQKYLEALHVQAKELQSKLEYHLLGNHLLENALSLFFVSCYLADEEMLQQAEKLLQKELIEQVLYDGGHFELSPMYHQIILYRLLDVVNICKACTLPSSKEILVFLEQKASVMLGWMNKMSFSNGTFPLFNDAAYGVAPSPDKISAYATRLGIQAGNLPLNDSGYRKFIGEVWEMFIDVGQPGPSYIPGHAHCDALNFVLNVNGKEVFVDTGTSVYGGNPEQRQLERGTAAHNTVQIDNREQSEIWGEFRMARRARVNIERDEIDCVEASHNGFYFKRKSHSRVFEKVNDAKILIRDTVHYCKAGVNKAFFHFHPERSFMFTDSGVIFEGGELSFDGSTAIRETAAVYSPEFGKSYKSRKVEVVFSDSLLTTITIQPL